MAIGVTRAETGVALPRNSAPAATYDALDVTVPDRFPVESRFWRHPNAMVLHSCARGACLPGHNRNPGGRLSVSIESRSRPSFRSRGLEGPSEAIPAGAGRETRHRAGG